MPETTRQRLRWLWNGGRLRYCWMCRDAQRHRTPAALSMTEMLRKTICDSFLAVAYLKYLHCHISLRIWARLVCTHLA